MEQNMYYTEFSRKRNFHFASVRNAPIYVFKQIFRSGVERHGANAFPFMVEGPGKVLLVPGYEFLIPQASLNAIAAANKTAESYIPGISHTSDHERSYLPSLSKVFSSTNVFSDSWFYSAHWMSR